MISEKISHLQKDVEKLKFYATCSKDISLVECTMPNHSSNPHQNEWDTFRVLAILAQHEPSIAFLSATHPLPFVDETIQIKIQNNIVRLAAILDDKLDEYITTNGLSIRRNPKLYDRIECINAHGLISDVSKLHALRNIRNDVGHLITIPTLLWTELFEYCDAVEDTLDVLRIISKTPPLKITDARMTALEESTLPSKKYERYQTFSIKGNDKIYCFLKWRYTYY